MKKTVFLFAFLLTVILSAWSQENQKSLISEISFGTNIGILGKGDYVGMMNEFSVRKQNKYSGINFSLNYVFSSSIEEVDEFWGFNDSGHSTTMIYSRINYFIEPISFKKLSFDIGAGLLGGYVSDIYVGYFGYDYSSSIPYKVTRYDSGWKIGYNLQINMAYWINNKIGIRANAGFDMLGSMNSFAYVGLKVSYKIEEN